MKQWTKRIVVAAMMIFSFAFSSQTVSANSLDKKEVTVRIETLEKEMNQLLDEIDEANAEMNKLEADIKNNTKDIKTTEAEIEKQQEIVEKRLTQARKQLQSLQTSELNYNVILSLLQAESISDFFKRIHSVTLLTDASHEHLNQAKADQAKLEKLQKRLDKVQKELTEQKAAEESKEAELTKKVATLKKDVAENKSLLASINKKEQQAAAKSRPQVTTASSSTSTPARPAANAGGWMTMQSTGYSTQEAGLSTHTATGINLLTNPRVIAVDPSVIPLGSVVEVEGLGTYIAGDTGGAIRGNIIDVHFSSLGQALSWGRRTVRVRIVG